MSFGPAWQRVLRARPIYAREMRQALRTGRIILLLVMLALILGLVILGLGSALGVSHALFQIFFSLAYFVVTMLGPGLAAVGLSSERDGRTWEALTLTGMNVRAIARDKFWVAATAVLAFLLMIAPSSLLTVFVGGTGIGELALAFVLLAVIGVVAVAFGTSVGASAASTGSATLVAMASSLVAAPLLYGAVGFGMSIFAHATWPDVPSFVPVWLPLAYVHARFDGWYVLLLLFMPAALISLALWFFRELTVARLSSLSQDRSSGLKRWFLVAVPVVGSIAAIPGVMTGGPARLGAWMGGLGGLIVFLAFAAFVLAGDALAASRRVEYRWQVTHAGWVTRVLGPGFVQTYMLVLVTGLLAVATFTLAGAVVLSAGSLRSPAAIALLACGEYWSAFLVFVIGFLAWARVRAGSIGGARVLTAMVTAVAIAAPWVVFLFLGYAASGRVQEMLLVAAPSPMYAFVIVGAIGRGEPHLALTSGLVCSVGWISMGLVLFGLAARRATRVVAEHRSRRANLDAQIAHEFSEDGHLQLPDAGAV